jgi:CO/xanthine dehydrogenase Mo-binding subunit
MRTHAWNQWTLGPRAPARVFSVFTATDLAEIENALNDPVPPNVKGYARRVLATGKLRYVGEPIAVVVAQDAASAVDAAEAVLLDLTPVEGAGDVQTASSDHAAILHDELGSNIAGHFQNGAAAPKNPAA